MGNKKILIEALKNLNKAKAPVKKKDIDYNSKMGYRDDSPFRKKKSQDITTPDGTIDMSNTGIPLVANGRILPPYSGIHQFDETVVTETPLEQAKKGGSKFSSNLQATNRLFKKNSLFKKDPLSKANPLFKKKNYKKKIYDPSAMYFQDGGPKYNNLPPTYLAALRNFVYPNIEADPSRTGYNSVNNTISYDPESPIENMSNDWWREHELFHDLQNQAGGMSTSGVVGQRPNPYVASDESMQGYYDRRGADIERTIDKMIAQDPNLQFIPRNKLAEGAGPGFIGAEDLQYSDPSTVEGEARQYEQYIREGNPSIFPKKQDGGVPYNYNPFTSVDPEVEETPIPFNPIRTENEPEGGSVGYQLGDEVDEATMRKLKKLGYTFNKM